MLSAVLLPPPIGAGTAAGECRDLYTTPRGPSHDLAPAMGGCHAELLRPPYHAALGRVHADRAFGRNCHHCCPYWSASACRSKSARIGGACSVPEQSSPVGDRAAQFPKPAR